MMPATFRTAFDTLERRLLMASAYSGVVFHDLDGDGVRDAGEPGLAALLFDDSDANRVHDLTNWNITDSTSDGAFAFDFPYASPTSQFRLDVRAQPGWVQTTPPVTIQKSQPRTDLSFGLVHRPATLQGRAFIDDNANGVWDIGEAPFHHAIFRFRQSWAGSQAELDGRWSMTIGAGVESTLVLDSSVLAVANLTTPTVGWTLIADEGETIDLGDVGLKYHPTRFSGSVLLDPDFDQDDTDASIPVVGARVFIDADGDSVFDDGETFTLTDAAGLYSMDVSPDQAMTLVVEPPAGLRLLTVPRATVTSSLGRDIGHDFALRRWADVCRALPTDFDGDGAPDTVFAIEGGAYVVGPTVSNGTTLLAPAPGLAFGAAADFNADGYADIAWYDRATGRTVLTLMQSGVTTRSVNLPAPLDSRWQINGAGDFNRDGHHDLLWRHSETGVLTTWRMNGTQLAGFSVVSQVRDPAWQIAGIIDMDYDGDADIIWNNTTSNALLLWRMNSLRPEGFKMIAVPRQSIRYIAVARNSVYDPITFLGSRGLKKEGLFLNTDAYGTYVNMGTWRGGV